MFKFWILTLFLLTPIPTAATSRLYFSTLKVKVKK